MTYTKKKGSKTINKQRKPKYVSVIIFGPSASGTSLLAHTCRLCGANFIDATDDKHLERVDIAEMLNRGQIEKAQEILQYMAGIAEMRNYPMYGIKLTCFGIDKWKLLKPAFDKYWKGAVKLTPFRHPYGYFKSQCAKKPLRAPDPRIDHIMNNYLGFFDTWTYLYAEEGFKLVEFPKSWEFGWIKSIMSKYIGWDDKVLNSHYMIEEVNHITSIEESMFKKRFLKQHMKWLRLLEMAE